ncbi:hypothetical protein l11_12550 [Neisseria weaveri LMG 5135]|nr:hypothetical protein l13_17850 [Neisseria weaveri ATCC 51223]EGV37502.1 hypothetical protein l11_12550 [Neisseria weaveri LMG 5135]
MYENDGTLSTAVSSIKGGIFSALSFEPQKPSKPNATGHSARLCPYKHRPSENFRRPVLLLSI